MKKLKKLVATTLLLTLTSFLIKSVAVSFNVYLTDKIGAAGVGLFSLITSVYMLFKTLAISGMSLAATRLNIEYPGDTRSIMSRLLICGITLGGFAGILLFSLSGLCADKWICDPSAAMPLKILSLSLPFISLSAVFSGYFTAIRKMARYSLVQVIEQISRISIAVGCLNLLIGYGEKVAVCGITAGITASEAVSFLCCLSIYLFDKRKLNKKHTSIQFIRKFLRIAVPDSLGSVLRSGLNTIQHLLVPISLRKSGFSQMQSMSDYGIIHGMALPIVLYPSSLLGVLSGLLIPEIAECYRKKDNKEISYITSRVLTATFIFSIATAGIIAGFSKELSLAVFNTEDAAGFLKLIAPLIPVMYVDMTTDGILKGLDAQLTIMKINILDSFLCVMLVLLLVPKTAMPGYIFTIYAGEVVNFILSFSKLKKTASFKIGVGKNIILPLISVTAAVFTAKAVLSGIISAESSLGTAAMITVAAILDLVIMTITGCISREELHWFKSIFY